MTVWGVCAILQKLLRLIWLLNSFLGHYHHLYTVKCCYAHAYHHTAGQAAFHFCIIALAFLSDITDYRNVCRYRPVSSIVWSLDRL